MADPFLSLALQLLDCLQTQLADSPAGPACEYCLYHEAALVPADGCACDCEDGRGQAWVRIAGTAIVEAESRSAIGCPRGRWSGTFEIGTRRCVATMDEDGNPPSCQTITNEAMWLAGDRVAQAAVLRCCPVMDKSGLTVVSATQLPNGPAGGCAGWTTLVTLQPIRECGCAEDGGGHAGAGARGSGRVAATRNGPARAGFSPGR